MDNIQSNILVWNEDVGFIRINEGTGDNLLDEDTEQGYVDYIMMDFLEYDGLDLTETDGAQIILKEMYQEKFKSVEDVVKHCIDIGFIPDVDYTILYAK